MKILIGCEFTATVRTAFEEKGFQPISCDLLPSERPGNHFIGDLREKLQEYWDLIIAFPPCTYLSSAGQYKCFIPNYGLEAWHRIKKRNEAVDFFLEIWFSNAKYKCIENPTGFISSTILKPTQIIHPYYFGDNKQKRTCLWLHNLPPLVHTIIDDLFSFKTHSDHKKTWIQQAAQKDRSRLSPYIAEAMASQWTEFIKNDSPSMYLPKESVQSEKFNQVEKWSKA